MPSPATKDEFLDVVRQAKVVDEEHLRGCLEPAEGEQPPETPRQVADLLIEEGLLTNYQSTLLLKGRTDGFKIGPYRILERLGAGATSNVYLCRHQAAAGRIAVKVMAVTQAKNATALKRFYREARAASALDHPNIVRVRDIDWDGETEYMVMEYVDGSSLQEIVEKSGPMDISRAAHYVKQAAAGLQYAHERNLVHRDIKPGNLLVNRKGTLKVLDMGLARFTEEEGGQLTKGGEILGAPEYLAPEQALDARTVDIRADIYSLGCTMYFLLTGTPPYGEEKTLAKKLLAKEQRPPKPIREKRAEVPAELIAVVDKMMAKDPAGRYATPKDVAAALESWTKTPIPPPPEKEMPQLSPAAREDRPTAPKRRAAPADAADAEGGSGATNWTFLAVVVVAVASFVSVWMYFKR
jgi:serine/threonine protein kinase